MPSVSKKQHNFMEAIAHSAKFAKKVGVPQSVGKDFAAADKGKKFKKGGVMAHSEKGEMKKDIAQDKKLIKKAFGMHDKQEHKGEHTNLSKLKEGGNVKSMGMKKMALKETMGPKTMSKDVEAGSNKLLKHGESGVQKSAHTKGMEERDYKTLGIQAGAKGGKGTMNADPIKMAKGGSASSRADGIASKGKTRGKMC
jgi:uncharacterized protein YyaL (SSP411 family)